MELFDAHCHLDDERLQDDLPQVLVRMRENGVTRCVCAGSDIKTSQSALALSRAHEGVYAAAGVHPHEAKDAPEDYLSQIEALLKQDKVVALGEIGLDYHYDFSPKDVQRRVFTEQLELAYALDVPAVFHIREAHGDMLDIFRARRNRLPRGVIHCFSGSPETCREYVSLGFYISFAGSLTFKKAPNLCAAALEAPPDRLLIETDSPYLSPEPLRGRRNEPANVLYVCQKLAALRGVTDEDIAALTTQNARRIYGV